MTIWILQPGEGVFNAQSSAFVPLHLPDMPDLTHASATNLKDMVRARHPDEPPERVPFYVDPIWMFINDIHIEDVVALVKPGSKQVYLYEVTGGYRYVLEALPHLRHQRPARLIKTLPVETFAEMNLLPQAAGIKVTRLEDADAQKFLNIKLDVGPARRLRVIQWLVVGMMIINLLVIVLGNFRDAHIVK